MTATPIPRTMALLRYGDLDITALRELPKGRRPITTHVASSDGERARAYERIREELDAGRQAFVVCPLVEESEALAARAATAEYERLRGGELVDYRVALLHGQMRPREKQEAMAAFAAGGADVLVATTVIEVGVDVPNATVMLVEGAERFGISQLHQLRGRIGRGEHASVCLLFGPKQSPRLRAVERDVRRLRARAGRPRAARRGRDRRDAPVGARAVSSSRGCPRTPRSSRRRACTPRRCFDADPELEPSPSTPCSPTRWTRRTAKPSCSRCRREGADPSTLRSGAQMDPPPRGRRMRVVAGTYGGRRLVAPPGDATRPTSDRVREALFSVLGASVERRARARPLRRLGRARASRRSRAGPPRRSSSTARRRRSRPSAPTSRRSGSRPTCAGWRRARRCARRPRRAEAYDLVFLDPPYRRAAELGRELSEALPAVLAPGARVVSESDRREPLELALALTDERRYGDTVIRIHDT